VLWKITNVSYAKSSCRDNSIINAAKQHYVIVTINAASQMAIKLAQKKAQSRRIALKIHQRRRFWRSMSSER